MQRTEVAEAIGQAVDLDVAPGTVMGAVVRVGVGDPQGKMTAGMSIVAGDLVVAFGRPVVALLLFRARAATAKRNLIRV